MKSRVYMSAVIALCIALPTLLGCYSLAYILEGFRLLNIECEPYPCCESDYECSDGIFCNGIETCAGFTLEDDKVVNSCVSQHTIACPCDPPYCLEGTFPCAEDQICDEGRGLCRPRCQTDADCSGDEFCTIGLCEVALCAPRPFICRNYREYPFCSNGAYPCADDEICDEKADMCLPLCQSDDDCDNGLYCTFAHCATRGVCAARPFDCTRYYYPWGNRWTPY